MSYEIEHGKRVLRIPKRESDERFHNWDTLLFMSCMASNNVHPRTFTWHPVAYDTVYSDEPNAINTWNKEVMVPLKIWEMGCHADGGSIKPWDRSQSGMAYLKAWKDLAAKPVSVFDGENLLFRPSVTIYSNNDTIKANLNAGAEHFRGYQKEKIHEAFKRLFPRDITSGWENASVGTADELYDTVFLWMNREHIPATFFIECPEQTAFLKGKDAA